MSSVVVVGGGLAGLAAACRLAQEGLRPTLYESRKVLGGRATAWTDPATGQRVDNGQHLLMGCNRSVKTFLETVGAADGVAWQARLELPLASLSHGRLRLRLPALPGALAALGGLLATRGLGWADRIGAARALNHFLRGGPRLEGRTVAEVLEDLDTPKAARDHLLEPLAVAVLNDQVSRASAPALAAVVRESFGAGGASAGLGLPRLDLESLFGLPARRYLEGRGCVVETQRPVEAVLMGAGGAEGVALESGETRPARAVVAAVTPWALAGLLPAEAHPEGVDKLAVSPIVSATFWLDRPVLEEPLVGLVGTSPQWAFNRSRLLGLEGPGQVLALTSSAAEALVGWPKEMIVEEFLGELRELFPEARPARLEHAVVVKEQRATVPLRPAEACPRPGPASGVPGLYLAGGWTSPEIPDTLEASARSGHRAAEALLADLRRGPAG